MVRGLRSIYPVSNQAELYDVVDRPTAAPQRPTTAPPRPTQAPANPIARPAAKPVATPKIRPAGSSPVKREEKRGP